MTLRESVKTALDRKFHEINDPSAGFSFFVSIHNFVEYIESAPSFSTFFAINQKGSRIPELSAKYFILKQVYQGIEDIDSHTKDDLGHDRYVAIRELSQIRNKDFSEGNNSFWRRRELIRKVAGETHKMLSGHLIPASEEIK